MKCGGKCDGYFFCPGNVECQELKDYAKEQEPTEEEKEG